VGGGALLHLDEMPGGDVYDGEADRFASSSGLRAENEVGVANVSSNLFSNVTRYHAQIGASVPKDTLQQLEWNLLSEAKTLFHQRKFEEALNTFTHCLAVTEKTRSAKDHAVRGAVIHNIASCLHNLGEMEAAQAYYEQAIDAFKKAYTPLVERAIYGDANKRRIEFVKERLVDISWGRKPDSDKYLDENGQKRPVAPVFGAVGDAGEQQLSEGWRAPPGAEDEPRLPSWARDDPPARYDTSRYDAQLMSAPRHYYDDPPARSIHGVRDQNLYAAGRHDAPAQHQQHQPPQQQQQYQRNYREEDPMPDTSAYDEDDAAQETARKEWLQYHMQTGEWDKAEELVVTAEEREDLEYLMEKERREARGGRRPTPAASSNRGASARSVAPPTREPKLIDDDEVL